MRHIAQWRINEMRKYLVITLCIFIGISIGIYIQPLVSSDNIFQQIKKFDQVLQTAYKNYVEEVDSQQLVEAAIKGMLNELDVHSVYIDAEDMKRVNEDFQGSFDGIGVEFDVLEDTLTVIAPISGGPSEALGILSGDKIVKIDGENAVGISRTEVPKKLKGPKGTIVELDIFRAGEKEILHFSVVRDKIPLYTVDAYYMIEGTDIGYVQVNRFAQTTIDELRSALFELKKQGMEKIMLDLRGNPGGYLNQAFNMAEEFLSSGDTIVYTKGRLKQFDEYYIGRGRSQFQKMPLIVLINAGSASASEIVSGSIQDLDRGLIVGETSYGKGLVQRQYQLPDGSAYRITIAKYYTPSGRCIQRPYKDKDKYRHLVGRLELEEGSYIKDAMKKIKDQVEKINADALENDKDLINLDSLPLYKTKNGRTVFGAGGVTPDYIIKSDTINKMSIEFRRKNLFNEFTDKLMHSKDGVALKEKYADNYSDFYKNFTVDKKMIKSFKELAVSKDIEWDEELYKKDEDYITCSIKAFIARVIWDRNKMTQIFSQVDKQLNKAIDLFPDAERITKNK